MGVSRIVCVFMCGGVCRSWGRLCGIVGEGFNGCVEGMRCGC